MKFKNLKYAGVALAALISMPLLSGCSSDEPDTENSIFGSETDTLDPDSYTYAFDCWIRDNYLKVYNCEFRYQMQHIGTDMSYNLVPATLDKAEDLALLTKYLWFDVYGKLVGEDFLKQYGPKILHLIGSPAYNPVNHTEILGLAEGGLKVSLFKVNELDVNNTSLLNEHYFKTMHHEFAHILHQTKTYPREFDLINTVNYEPNNWQDRNGAIVNSLGFSTTYASSQTREDFAETCANYITRTYDQWDLMLWIASKGWETTYADDYAYAYYYYASNSDRENDIRTYVGLYISPEANDGIFGIAETTAKSGSGPAAYSKIHTTVAAVEDYIKRMQQQHELVPVADTDLNDGKANIEQKVSIARNWFNDAWGLDIDQLRDEVQRRQSVIPIDSLRNQVNQYK